jgi:metallo-beta-lactamase family protein
MCRDIKLIQSEEETEKLASDKNSKIIIASSGMATGGRVLTYFEHYLGDAKATILLVGYQGEGTRGRDLLNGNKEIKLRGKFWEVKAKVSMVGGLSAHADQNELINWLSNLKQKPKHIFITHGEKASAKALGEKLKDTLKLEVIIPQLNQTFTV